jgi:cyclopropane fatty-acyl-phospholipid synthase-like methyltransferase
MCATLRGWRDRAGHTAIIILLALLAVQAQSPPSSAPRQLDAPYVPTPPRVVDAMLKMARVTARDVVYDLGCGDGRIPIEAALKYGARGVGVDLDSKRIEDAKENAKAAGVTDKVSFIAENVFDTDFRDATVVFLYMSLDVNQRLMPKLKSLKPGARIVSHVFDMGPAWPPDERGETDGKTYYLWIVRD